VPVIIDQVVQTHVRLYYSINNNRHDT